MIGCEVSCPREAEQQDNTSLGVIANDETIARGAFHPSGGDGYKLKVRSSLFSKDDLLAGKGSVWRLQPKGISLNDAVVRIKASRPATHLFAVAAIPASDIRAIQFPDAGGRAFCVVDECDCDTIGNKHQAHAHIAVCKKALASGLHKECEVFVTVWRDLATAFGKNLLFKEPLAKAA